MTPSGGGHAPTPDRSESSATGSALKRVDNREPVTEGPVDIRGSLLVLIALQALCWWSLSGGGSGSVCCQRRGLGEGRALAAGQGVGSRGNGQGQSAVP